MPIYEYGCQECGHIAEVWAKVSDPPPEACEQCGAPSPERLISRTSFQLKGGGWYAQGYNSGKGGSSGSSDSSSSGSSSSDSSSSDSSSSASSSSSSDSSSSTSSSTSSSSSASSSD